MYVKVNRNQCPNTLAFCERCFGKFLRHPMGYERRCFEVIEEGDDDRLIIDLTTGDKTVTLRLNEEQRNVLAGEGWANFMSFAVPMYRNDN